MSTIDARWLALGNPTLNTGAFYEACNGDTKWRNEGDELSGKWTSFTVGSADSSLVAPEWITEQRSVLGESTDDFRVRVLGLPPRESLDQFITPELASAAMSRKVELFPRWPLVLGVDVARQGADSSVIVPRRGRIVYDRIQKYPDYDLRQLRDAIAFEIMWWREEKGLKVRAVFIEGGGSIGWGVIEMLWDMGYSQVVPVNPGARSIEPELYSNTRCEMYGQLKNWLLDGGQLPNDSDLFKDLINLRTKPDAAMRLKLWSKDEMRRKGIKSTDNSDALALTWGGMVELEPEKRGDRWDEEDYTGRDKRDWMTG